MNNKGFAVTGMLYIVLLIFIVMYSSILVMFANRRKIYDTIKEEILGKEYITNPSRQVTTSDIGSYVNYTPDNPTWDETRDGVELTEINTQGTFSIYDNYNKFSYKGANKNNSISCAQSTIMDNGWIIMDVSNNGEITLIHAGTPECYYSAYEYSEASKELLGKVSVAGNEGTAKAWTKYGNTLYANSVHYMNIEDVNTILKNQNDNKNYYLLDNDYSNSTCYNKSIDACGYNNKLINLPDYYYISGTYSDKYLYNWAPSSKSYYYKSGIAGVRPVIILKSNVTIRDDANDGTKNKPYNLLIQ